MKVLVKFYQDFGRMGSLSGLFIEDSDRLSKSAGKTVEFGEALGKHSDVSCRLGADNLTVLSDDQELIAKLDSLHINTGYNPIDYIEELG